MLGAQGQIFGGLGGEAVPQRSSLGVEGQSWLLSPHKKGQRSLDFFVTAAFFSSFHHDGNTKDHPSCSQGSRAVVSMTV